MSTGYLTEYGGYQQDLDTVFQPGSTGGDTGFKTVYQGGVDLSALFAPRSSGLDIGFNTGFIALDGRDLREWFCKIGSPPPFSPGFNLAVNWGKTKEAFGDAAAFLNSFIRPMDTGKIQCTNDWTIEGIPGSDFNDTTFYWGAPPVAGAGASYWVKLQGSGDPLDNSSALNTWYPCANQPAWGYQISGASMAKQFSGTLYLANAPSDANIISSTTCTIQAELYT